MKLGPAIRLLMVEDNIGDARLIRELLKEEGAPTVAFTLVDCLAAAEAYLAAHRVDVVLLDLALPDAHGLEALHRAKAAAGGAPLVILTGCDDDALAIQALQQGAQDYLVKGQIDKRRLARALRYAIERQATEDALVADSARAQVTLRAMGDAVIGIDADARITFLNPAAEAMTGWTRAEGIGLPMRDVLPLLDASTRLPALDDEPKTATTARSVDHTANYVLVSRAGAVTPVEFCVSPVHDNDGAHLRAVIVLRDASVAQAHARELAHAAQHDLLTGLPNRLLLADRIARAIAAAPRHEKQVAILFVDLDGFKQVNDTFGHAVGDRLLQSVAQRLVECVRQSDTVTRQGGDEFVVLLSEVHGGDKAADVARRMLKAIGAPHVIDHHELRVQASIGVSIYPTDGADAETLIKHADTAMYQAKRNGWRYRFYKPAMNARSALRLSFEEGLRRAFERQELSVGYQPRVSLRTGSVVGAAASLQWLHPTRGMIGASEFVPAAERCGLMPAIGDWMLRETCHQAQRWRDDGVSVATLAVSIPGAQVRAARFADQVLALLAESGLAPAVLELGLPEEVLMHRTASVTASLASLRERGVRIAVDDFGTGLSSLTHLRSCPIEVLRLHPSLVQDTGGGSREATIAGAIISIADSLKLHAVATGVATPEERRFLEGSACGEAQGPYFGRCVAAPDFARLLDVGAEA
jgi:diguanylate cyclase (GGDEF)-like protein/PAS domain S-box-containing protein